MKIKMKIEGLDANTDIVEAIGTLKEYKKLLNFLNYNLIDYKLITPYSNGLNNHLSKFYINDLIGILATKKEAINDNKI